MMYLSNQYDYSYVIFLNDFKTYGAPICSSSQNKTNTEIAKELFPWLNSLKFVV